ncbi:MAG: hypothetical protein MUF33_00615 [Candidatus Nanopelagicales bacterium]|jgi:hypothetical protein|nr:hypothetical protein [Candidatus Nanopelagicales bacterium]MCU0297001.1 hypothetical protein [Candidatus Nanopelagicales bacterium]
MFVRDELKVTSGEVDIKGVTSSPAVSEDRELPMFAAVREALTDQPLCPDDLLDIVRTADPAVTLDKLLATLYNNRQSFNRLRGRWYVRELSRAAQLHDHRPV